MDVDRGVARIGAIVVTVMFCVGAMTLSGAGAETAATSQPASATRQAASFKVVVQVNDEEGKPIEGSTVSLGVMKGRMATFMASNSRKTDKQGQVEYESLSMEQGYSTMARAEGYGAANAKVNLPAADEAREAKVTLVLKKLSAEISGVVVDEEGKPRAKVQVMMHSPGTFNAQETTDAEGRFVFHVPEGEKASLTVAGKKPKIVHAEAGQKDVKLVSPKNSGEEKEK